MALAVESRAADLEEAVYYSRTGLDMVKNLANCVAPCQLRPMPALNAEGPVVHGRGRGNTESRKIDMAECPLLAGKLEVIPEQ